MAEECSSDHSKVGVPIPGKRRVAVLSTTRADLWPLVPVIENLASDPRTEVTVVLIGVHTDADLSSLPESVPTERVPLSTEDSSELGLVRNAVTSTIAWSEAMSALSPDIALMLGDRYELLGPASACLVHGVPVAHLHGGELTLGAIDDCVRHALTKLSHLHFCAAEPYADRIRGLGEEPWRVFVSGAPALDRVLVESKRYSRRDLERRLGIGDKGRLALLTYHPPTVDRDVLHTELEAILDALGGTENVLATYPGQDPGRERILERLERFRNERPGVVLVPSLGPLYPSAMQVSDFMIGNSSSGIVEAPILGVPVINVGDRQDGRLRSPGILDVAGRPTDIIAAVSTALSPGFRSRLVRGRCAYGDGHAAGRIVEVLASVDAKTLFRKRFIDQPNSPGECY